MRSHEGARIGALAVEAERKTRFRKHFEGRLKNLGTRENPRQVGSLGMVCFGECCRLLLADGIAGRGAELLWRVLSSSGIPNRMRDFYSGLGSCSLEVSEFASRFPEPDQCVFSFFSMRRILLRHILLAI